MSFQSTKWCFFLRGGIFNKSFSGFSNMRAKAGDISVKIQMQIMRKADNGSGTPKNMFTKIGNISPLKINYKNKKNVQYF
jgi:hypothetical protein